MLTRPRVALPWMATLDSQAAGQHDPHAWACAHRTASMVGWSAVSNGIPAVCKVDARSTLAAASGLWARNSARSLSVSVASSGTGPTPSGTMPCPAVTRHPRETTSCPAHRVAHQLNLLTCTLCERVQKLPQVRKARSAHAHNVGDVPPVHPWMPWNVVPHHAVPALHIPAHLPQHGHMRPGASLAHREEVIAACMLAHGAAHGTVQVSDHVLAAVGHVPPGSHCLA